MADALPLAEGIVKKADLDSLNYVFFVIPDIHGLPRGQVVPRHCVKEKMEKGPQLCYATLYFEPNMVRLPHLDMLKTWKNGTWKPDPSTLQTTPWSNSGPWRTGMVLCELTGNGVEEEGDTRQLVKRLLNQLWKDHGLTLKSAFGIEFSVFKTDDGSNLGCRQDHHLELRTVQPDLYLFFELVDQLQEAGLKVQGVTPQFGYAQWKLTVEPLEGVLAADLAFHLKNAVKIFFKRRGFDATFMSVPEIHAWNVNSLHLHHSLWTGEGRNAMEDDSKEDAISELALRWNAGLLHHAPAMTALCCPTVNCYRSSSNTLYSGCADWSVEGRQTITRFKVDKGNVFLDARLGLAPASPYLLMASHLVAGMSGLKQEMTSPPQRMESMRGSSLLPWKTP